MVVNVSGIKWSFVRAVIITIIVIGKCTTLFIEQESCKLSVQVVLYEPPQIFVRGIIFDVGHHISELFQKVLAHKVIFHTPAKIDCQMIVGRNCIYWQIFFSDAFKMVFRIVHHFVRVVREIGAAIGIVFAFV